MLAFCRAEYGAVHLWRGEWTEAEKVLKASLDDFSRSRPAWAGGPLLGLAELRRRQGRPEEAALLLDEAGASEGAQLCRARLALDRGETLRTIESLERLLRQLPAGRKLDRAPALELLVRARIARGELDEAVSTLEELRTSSGSSAPRRCGPAPIWPTACWRRPAVTTSGLGRCWRMPWIASREAARRSRPPRRGSSSPPACSRSVVPRRPSARRSRPWIACSTWG